MQPAPQDDVLETPPIPDAAPPTDAPPEGAIVLDAPTAPGDTDGTVEVAADPADSARPTRPYNVVLGGDATD